MIDSDLARLYGVTTKRLNEQVKRNQSRFPNDFMFQITEKEKAEVVANCDHLKKLKYSHSLPYVFSEHGALMLANVLSSQLAINTSVEVVRAFIQMREFALNYNSLKKKIDEIENKLSDHDSKFKVVFETIRRSLLSNQAITKKKIGIKD